MTNGVHASGEMANDAGAVGAMLEAASSAAARGASTTADLVVADLRIRIRFVGRAVAEALRPALDPRLEHAPDDSPSADAEIDAYDSVEMDAAAPPACAELRRGGGAASASFSHFNAGSGVLVAYDRARRRGAWWTRDARDLPQWEIAAPLRPLLAWILAEAGATVVHAASIAVDGSAVLLAAPGGSGKSTTALRCLAEGFEFLGDNNVAVTLGSKPRVHSLFASASLRRASAVRVDGFEERAVDRRGAEAKAFSLPGADRAERFPAHRALAAIVVPRIGTGRKSRLVACSPAAALRALAPSTLFAQPGSCSRDLARMSELVRRLPCHALELADDGAAASTLLRRLLAAPVAGGVG